MVSITTNHPFIMTAKECRKLLTHHLSPFLEQQGYQYLPELSQYRKQTSYGFSCFILSVSPYDSECLFEMHVGLRRNDVEGMIYSSTNGSKDFTENSMTLVGSLGKLVSRPHWRFILKKESDVIKMVREIIPQIEGKAIPFLENSWQLKQLDEIINSQPNQKVPFIQNNYYRCMRGIAVAVLNRRKNLTQLYLRYRYILQADRAPQVVVDSFDKLSSLLMKMSMN